MFVGVKNKSLIIEKVNNIEKKGTIVINLRKMTQRTFIIMLLKGENGLNSTKNIAGSNLKKRIYKLF